jgi:hypothetical protein
MVSANPGICKSTIDGGSKLPHSKGFAPNNNHAALGETGCNRKCESIAPTGQRLKAQGWPRFLRSTLGNDMIAWSTLKGLRKESPRNPFRVDFTANTTQGRPQKARPTLGFGAEPLRGTPPAALGN